MFVAVRTFLLRNGLFLFMSTLELVHQAPLPISDIPTNFSRGATNSILFSRYNNVWHYILRRRASHSWEKNWLNISDGQTIQQKQTVAYYLKKIEDEQEREHNVSLLLKSTNDTIPYVFEEDIILTPHQARILYESRNPRQKRKLHTDLQRHWQLPIQYAFDGSHNETQKSIIKSALHYWESFTCINFEEIVYKDNSSINDNQVYIVFTSNEGCWSFVGKSTYAEQKVSLSGDCMYEGHVLHEIGHVIGFWHEHARPDREEHISVQQNAIQFGKAYNFLYISWKDLDTLDMPYDVGSIMHYSSTAYSIDTVNPVPPTIVTNDPWLQRALGQRFQLSFYDVKLANKAYCPDKCNGTRLTQPCQHDGYQDPKQCSRCRCPEGLGGYYCETAAASVGDTCGGVLNVTGSPSIFGFPFTYRFGQQCNWFLKAPKDTRIFFAIESNRIMNYQECSTNPYIECLNYVEVRYSHNLAKTGARICCSYLSSNKPIISEGNEMLVLMRANGYGSYGFQAKVWAESCGGCASGTEATHQPCSKQVSFVCQHEWNYTVYNPCPSGNVWWVDTTDCNKLITKTALRSGICFRSELFCCYGYQFNGTTCVKSTSTSTVSVLQPTSLATSNLNPTVYPTGIKENDPILGWGNWTAWSNCSSPCGGCGNQTRQRLCYDPLLCNGKSFEVESKLCNTQPCYSTNIGTRTKAVEKVCYTNPITLEMQKCTVYEKETYTYMTETCCAGYTKNINGTCLKSTT